MLNHSIFSQSYPTQRVEKGDTLVIMTKAQAVAMNNRFLILKKDIDSLKEFSNGTISFVITQDSLRNHELVLQKRLCEEQKKQLRSVNAQLIASSSAFVTWVTFIYLLINN